MVELIRHLLGLCPDHAAHMNLLDLLLGGGLLAFAGGYFKTIKSFIFRRPSDRSQNRAHKHNCDHSHHHDCDHKR